MGATARRPAVETLRSCGPGELDQDLPEFLRQDRTGISY